MNTKSLLNMENFNEAIELCGKYVLMESEE